MKLIRRLVVFIHDGRVGEVCAGHHERVNVLAHQQVVKRRVRQHHSDVAVLAYVPKPFFALFQQYDGALRAFEYSALILVNNAHLAHTVRVPAHEREGLFVPVLAAAKLLYAVLPPGKAGKVHPAETLHGDDFPLFKVLSRKLGGVAREPFTVTVEEEKLRPALGAAVRLCVVAPVAYVRILLRARRAHFKLAHRGLCPVVRDVTYDGKSRSAVGAVNKGVTVTPVALCPKLSQTVAAYADIG